jgi:hypothetical protein
LPGRESFIRVIEIRPEPNGGAGGIDLIVDNGESADSQVLSVGNLRRNLNIAIAQFGTNSRERVYRKQEDDEDRVDRVGLRPCEARNSRKSGSSPYKTQKLTARSFQDASKNACRAGYQCVARIASGLLPRLAPVPARWP